MAAGDSIVSIVNIGLIALGEDPISDLDAPYKRAILMKERYGSVRRAVLEAYPWRFAKRLAQLAASATPPPFGYGNAFDLPADFVRLFTDVDDSDLDWEIVGNQIMTDAGGPLNVVYVADIVDPTRFPPLFCELVGLELAVANCQPITQSSEKEVIVTRKRDAKVAEARTASAQQASPREPDHDVLLESRN